MLTKAEIEENKSLFIELVNSISREFDKDALIQYLCTSDFFDAPASTVYHNSFTGGLCLHSLNVYDTLYNISRSIYPNTTVPNDQGYLVSKSTCPYSDDSLKIVSLFHDISKINFYEKTIINQKVYSDTGSKNDALGNFDWISTPGYKVKSSKDRFIFSTHGQNSEYLLNSYIPLTQEESCAIINHHSVYDNPSLDVTTIFNNYSLACLLHVADMLSTYILEKV